VTKEALQQIELDRTNDAVYTATTGVARAVIDMIHSVQKAQADKYVELVKVGEFCSVTFISFSVMTSLHRRQIWLSVS